MADRINTKNTRAKKETDSGGSSGGSGGSGGSSGAPERPTFNVPDEDTTTNLRNPIGMSAPTDDQLVSGLNDRWWEPGGTFDMVDVYYGEDADAIMGSMSPEFTVQVQRALVGAGILSDSDSITYGIWGSTSATAFKNLLGVANRSGISWDATLNNLLSTRERNGQLSGSSGGGSRGGGSSRAAFAPRIPDRDEVRRSYKAVATRLLGGNFVDDSEAEAFADSFTQQVVAAQRQAYDGQTVNEAPSLEAETTETLEASRGDEVEANRFAGYVGVLERLVGGS